jgi:GNAT superfamily N-acetyltransferase
MLRRFLCGCKQDRGEDAPLDPTMNGSGEITLNYVSPDARFRGISKGLLQRLELQATDLGIQRITLQSSLTALRLYESAGYRRNEPPTKGFGITFCHPMIKNLQSGLSGRCSRLGSARLEGDDV